MTLLSAWLYLMLTRARGSARVIYIDMCELSVIDMLLTCYVYVTIGELYDNNYDTMCQ